MSLRDVVLLTNELATVTAVSAALQSNGQLTNGNVFREFEELATRLERGSVPAALIDIDAQPERSLAALEPLVRKFSGTKFVVLSGVMRNDLLLEAMQVGARHFLLKQSVPSDLHNVLHRLCPEASGTAHGAAVTILSAGGGCGATTLSVNLAGELQATTPESGPALVMDLDPHYGAVAAYLGLDGEYGIFDLLNRAGQIDAQLVSSAALARSDRLHALLSTSRSRLGETIAFDPQRVGQALEACKNAYRWTVVDAPRVSSAVAAELSRRSRTTLLLLQLTIKEIRVARQMLAALRERGISEKNIILIASRYRKRGPLITLDEARRALGLEESQELRTSSNDFYAVAEALNLGKPLAESSPRSDYRRDVQKLAGAIVTTRKPDGSKGILVAAAMN